MKVLLLEKIITDADGGNLDKGAVVDLPPHIAQKWVNRGKAKFVPIRQIETATIEAPETTSRRSAKASRKKKRAKR
jgi:hypothetical protein